jgi:hypothetical protein
MRRPHARPVRDFTRRPDREALWPFRLASGAVIIEREGEETS